MAEDEGITDKIFKDVVDATTRLDVLDKDIAKLKKSCDGVRSKLGAQARGRLGRAEKSLQIEHNLLTPAQTRLASAWQRKVIDKAWQEFRANESITFRELLDAVMSLPNLPVDEEAIRRFLNQYGFKGKSGRPKK